MTITDQRDYARELVIAAPPARVFETIATLEGLADWWTPLVSGSPAEGGEVTLRVRGARRTDRHAGRESTPSSKRQTGHGNPYS